MDVVVLVRGIRSRVLSRPDLGHHNPPERMDGDAQARVGLNVTEPLSPGPWS